MNYRHAFHAGNFGDVLKHLVLVELLTQLTAKDKPLFFLDTHAGRGQYDLESPEGRRSGEADAGIRRLAAASGLPEAARRYVELVRASDAGNAERIRSYPGSPRIASLLLRDGDRAALCELQRGEAVALRRACGGDARFAVHERDGYEALGALLPPRERRGLVLVDPSFESQEGEFDSLVAALGRALARWPLGTYAIWYPIKRPGPAKRLHDGLVAAGARRLLVAELCIHPRDNRAGLNGSGVAIINPPWKTDLALSEALPAVHAALSPDGAGDWRVSWVANDEAD
jgi:23S rRNA (adenine2030-N6)-methyltransferase